MSILDRDRWRVLAPLLDHALELTEAERAEWLGQLRAVAPAVAAELASLLDAERAADAVDFLARPSDAVVRAQAALRPPHSE